MLGVHRPRLGKSDLFLRVQIHPDLPGDGAGNPALKRECVATSPSITLGAEDVPVAGHLDQLSGDPNFVTGLHHAAFHHSADVQFASDLGERFVSVL